VPFALLKEKFGTISHFPATNIAATYDFEG